MRRLFVYMSAAMACLHIAGCYEQDSCSGGFGGSALFNYCESDVTSAVVSSTGAQDDTCHWCSGPRCDSLDEACATIEADSHSVICRGITGEPVGCFTTVDLDSQQVLCCCEPGVCPGLW